MLSGLYVWYTDVPLIIFIQRVDARCCFAKGGVAENLMCKDLRNKLKSEIKYDTIS